MAISRIKRNKGTVYRVRIRTSPINRVGKTFKRKVDAETWESEMKLKLRDGQGIQIIKPIRFEELTEKFMRMHCEPNMSFTGRERYQGAIRVHILPYFSGRMITNISRLEVENFKASLSAMKSAVTTFMVFKAMMNKAVEWELLKTNPAQLVKAPRKPKSREEHWSEGEVHRFLKGMENHPRLPLYLIALNTGLRAGEIFGLRWDCVDFERGVIQVRRSFCQKQNLNRDHTKTNNEWLVQINEPLRKLLLRLKISKTDERVLRPEEIGMKDVTHTAKVLKKDAKQVGVRPIRFHDLRHTFASQFMTKGGDLFALSKFLGHKKIEMTQRYAHFSAEHRDRMKDLVSFDVPTGAEIIQLAHKRPTSL